MGYTFFSVDIQNKYMLGLDPRIDNGKAQAKPQPAQKGDKMELERGIHEIKVGSTIMVYNAFMDKNVAVKVINGVYYSNINSSYTAFFKHGGKVGWCIWNNGKGYWEFYMYNRS